MSNIPEPVVPVHVFNQVSQLAHIAGGLAAVFGSVVLFGQGSKLYAVGAVAVLAGLKEFIYDQLYEDATVRGSNLEDWAFYMLGAGIALALSFVANIV